MYKFIKFQEKILVFIFTMKVLNWNLKHTSTILQVPTCLAVI